MSAAPDHWSTGRKGYLGGVSKEGNGRDSIFLHKTLFSVSFKIRAPEPCGWNPLVTGIWPVGYPNSIIWDFFQIRTSSHTWLHHGVSVSLVLPTSRHRVSEALVDYLPVCRYRRSGDIFILFIYFNLFHHMIFVTVFSFFFFFNSQGPGTVAEIQLRSTLGFSDYIPLSYKLEKEWKQSGEMKPNQWSAQNHPAVGLVLSKLGKIFCHVPYQEWPACCEGSLFYTQKASMLGPSHGGQYLRPFYISHSGDIFSNEFVWEARSLLSFNQKGLMYIS